MDLSVVSDAEFARYFDVAQRPGYLEHDHSPGLPYHPRLQLGRFYRSGGLTGIDYHDVLNLGGNRFAIVMADISGPGAASAAAMIRSVVGGHAGRHEDSGSLLHYMSEYFHYRASDAVLATGICAVIDVRRRTIRVACAAHPAPLMARAGAVAPMSVHPTMPLGKSGLILTSEHQLQPGDRLLFYTDGVAGRGYDVERLREALAQTGEIPVTRAVDYLAHDIEQLAGDEIDDDQTLLMVGIN